MQKLAMVFLLFLLITAPTTADTLSESEQTVNAVARLTASTVKIMTPDTNGSGFYIAPRTILTNEHVVHKTTGIVRLIAKSGKECAGTIYYKDEGTDLALISTECAGPPLPLTEKAQEGQTVIALGNPKGYEFLSSKGIICGFTRQWITFDAKVNYGSSGGVLANLDGEVVGIVTRKDFDYEYIAFALDGKRINTFLERVRQTHTIE